MCLPKRRLSHNETFYLLNWSLTSSKMCKQLPLKQIEPWLVSEKHGLVWVGGVRKRKLAPLIDPPHGLLHFLEARDVVGGMKEIVVNDISFVSHLERTYVLGTGSAPQLAVV